MPTPGSRTGSRSCSRSASPGGLAAGPVREHPGSHRGGGRDALRPEAPERAEVLPRLRAGGDGDDERVEAPREGGGQRARLHLRGFRRARSHHPPRGRPDPRPGAGGIRAAAAQDPVRAGRGGAGRRRAPSTTSTASSRRSTTRRAGSGSRCSSSGVRPRWSSTSRRWRRTEPMAKKIKAYIQAAGAGGPGQPGPAGRAGPRSARRQHHGVLQGVQRGHAGRRAGLPTSVVITVFADSSFTFITRTPPAAVLLRKAGGGREGERRAERRQGGAGRPRRAGQDRERQDAGPQHRRPGRGGPHRRRNRRSMGIETEGVE